MEIRVFSSRKPVKIQEAPKYKKRNFSVAGRAKQESFWLLPQSSLRALHRVPPYACAKRGRSVDTRQLGRRPLRSLPQRVLDLLRKRLGCSPPCPYSFAASEALRLHTFKLDLAQVRRCLPVRARHSPDYLGYRYRGDWHDRSNKRPSRRRAFGRTSNYAVLRAAVAGGGSWSSVGMKVMQSIKC